MNKDNLYTGIPASLPDELFSELLRGNAFRMERIVSHGHCSPAGFWYEQPENEWVLLLKGAARLRFEQDDGVVYLGEGDYLAIPAGVRHRLEWTDPARDTVWLAVFY